MITNLHEQRTARRKLTELETALARHREHRPAHRDREMHDLVGAGFESQIEELSVELDTYDQLASGADETATIAAGTLASQTQHAGETLISARIAAGLSQQQLANSVGVHEGVIRRYERERYRSTSLARIDEIACALAQPKAVTSVPPPTGDGEWIAASREAVREASRQLLSRRLTKAKRPGNLERQVIALRFFERLSITSIANEVGISIDEAHQIVEAVNAELRVLLQSPLNPESDTLIDNERVLGWLWVLDTVASMPQRHRDVVSLMVKGNSLNEVAEELGISTSAVRGTLVGVQAALIAANAAVIDTRKSDPPRMTDQEARTSAV